MLCVLPLSILASEAGIWLSGRDVPPGVKTRLLFKLRDIDFDYVPAILIFDFVIMERDTYLDVAQKYVHTDDPIFNDLRFQSGYSLTKLHEGPSYTFLLDLELPPNKSIPESLKSFDKSGLSFLCENLTLERFNKAKSALIQSMSDGFYMDEIKCSAYGQYYDFYYGSRRKKNDPNLLIEKITDARFEDSYAFCREIFNSSYKEYGDDAPLSRSVIERPTAKELIKRFNELKNPTQRGWWSGWLEWFGF